MREIWIAAAAIALLAGCASGPSPEQIAAADDARCTEYGMPAGHPDYGACRFALDQQRFLERQAQANNAFAAAAQLGAMQQTYQYQYAPAYAPAPPITCSRAGSASYTCY